METAEAGTGRVARNKGKVKYRNHTRKNKQCYNHKKWWHNSKVFSHECTNLCHFSAFEAEVAKLPLILLFQTELRAELRGPKCLFLRELPCRKKDLQCNAFLALSNL